MTATASLTSFGYDPHSWVTPETGTVRPWIPPKVIPIRLFGTNKTNPTPQGKGYGRRNIREIGVNLDTTRGCGGAVTNKGRGCFGDCYYIESVKRYHVMYWVPVSMRLDKTKLARDLEELRADYVRNGVSGDPSYDWLLAVTTAEFCDLYDKTTVLLTRFWKTPDDFLLARLADAEVIIHGSLSALDPLAHRAKILRELERYEEIGGKSVRRIITAAFRTELDDYWAVQDDLMSLPYAFQQPLRIKGTNPFIDLFDLEKYHGLPSNTSGKVTKRWRSAGDLYGSRGCYSHCYECSNRCATNPRVWSDWP